MRIAIVGGGLSGLATAYQIQELAAARSVEVSVTIYEKENRLGGTIKTDVIDGYWCETGPPGFLSNKPETIELAQDLSVHDALIPSNDSAKKRYLFVDGALQKIPESPPAFLRSKLLSTSSKLGMLKELWAKRAPEGADETIASFAERHLGPEATEKLIDAVTLGIFGGDPEQLSLKSCFPIMHELEKEGRGSLIRGSIRRLRGRRKQARRTGQEPATAAVRGRTRLISFQDGMGTLIDGLESGLTGDLKKSSAVESIHRKGQEFVVDVQGRKTSDRADLVILAAPAYAASEILGEFDAEMAKTLDEIEYAPITVVNLGYRKSEVANPLDGFGFLVPHREKRQILGSIWTTSVFPGTAPEDRVSLRTMLGGTRNAQAARLSQKKAVDAVLGELKEMVGVSKDPEFVKVYQYKNAIPQYTVGHSQRLGQLDKRLWDHPGLFLTGNAYLGVGVNDCTRNAKAVAHKVFNYIDILRGK